MLEKSIEGQNSRDWKCNEFQTECKRLLEQKLESIQSINYHSGALTHFNPLRVFIFNRFFLMLVYRTLRTATLGKLNT